MAEMTHVFLKKCGCLGIAVVNKPAMFVELTKAHKTAEKQGLKYKLMPTEEFKVMEWQCPEHKGIIKMAL